MICLYRGYIGMPYWYSWTAFWAQLANNTFLSTMLSFPNQWFAIVSQHYNKTGNYALQGIVWPFQNPCVTCLWTELVLHSSLKFSYQWFIIMPYLSSISHRERKACSKITFSYNYCLIIPYILWKLLDLMLLVSCQVVIISSDIYLIIGGIMTNHW